MRPRIIEPEMQLGVLVEADGIFNSNRTSCQCRIKFGRRTFCYVSAHRSDLQHRRRAHFYRIDPLMHGQNSEVQLLT